ncbi:carboxypeptidase-like regulatory domain-containing protein [Winogradskyella alexanderae]|uniref:Carboxypeptidase-like regulatory domain-containing protein n=1 Tax=Winogradskyella alexanderae TaxID=2877123 RepID=A0ABS7XTC1_9FLAO|nr:carboxypeptidase-like regulatory domain-containing protein [Winogradskyella alexanderae]MCA0133035.1 carboxypeptidase-like regulatory domain-containing protein [Winogradskyella alexanderae]
MKKNALIIFCMITLTAMSQDIKRVSVNGKIIVSVPDKEGVAVYNTSSNMGTVTDENGEFKINVALNDVVEFAALQFKDFTVIITEEILKSKQMTVILVEEINKLDEVVLLPFGLTGNLGADLENVRTYNVSLDEVYFGLDHIEDFKFSADYNTKVENVAFNEYNPRVDNMLNLVNLAGFLVSQVVDIEGKNLTERDKTLGKTPFKKALEQYSFNFIHVNFGIPLNEIDAFIDYVENQGIDKTLLAKDKEIQFLERINQLSRSYLKTKGDKN